MHVAGQGEEIPLLQHGYGLDPYCRGRFFEIQRMFDGDHEYIMREVAAGGDQRFKDGSGVFSHGAGDG